jgi:cytochrome c oxidase cbb3-type subunit 1
MTAHVFTLTDVANQSRNDGDASLRLPVLIFFGCAVSWLTFGLFLGAIAAFKLVWPHFLDGPAFLTFGRIAPAAVNALVYGWASSAGFGIALWLLARLGHASLDAIALPIAGAIFWNVGVMLGICAILAGYSRSIFLLEFPGFVSAILFIAYVFIAIWGIILFRRRTPGSVFVSSWYLVAALLWFPWLYFTGNALLVWHPISGAAQAPVAAWFASGILSLWLTPIALACAFYLVPQILGRRLVSYNLSLLGFWSFALFAAWTGTAQLVGGPVPAWMVSAGVVASILLFIPVLVVSINLFGTMRGSFDALHWSPSLGFVTVGASAFLLVFVEGALLALPKVNAVLHFTDVALGQGLLMLLGFVSMAFFGAMYYIVPRLIDRPWACDGLIRWHFWLFTIATGLAFACLTFGGITQGFALNDPGVTFLSSLDLAWPYRLMTALCAVAFLVGAKCFGALLFLAVLSVFELRPKSSTL